MTRWSFAFSMPVLIAGLAFIGLATWLSYLQWRRQGASRGLLGLECLRWTLVGLIFLTLGRPELIREVRSDEPPAVVVLVDASRSMSTRDVMVNEQTVISRSEWVEQQLARDVWGPLGDRYRVLIEEFSAPPAGPQDDADGRMQAAHAPDPLRVEQEGTDINAALEAALARHRNMRAVVVLSDGDWNLGKSPVVGATKLRLANVPVFCVAVGSERYLPDIEVAGVSAPSYALAGEQVFIPFTIQSYLPREVHTTVTLSGPAGVETQKQVTIPAMGQLQDAVFWTPMQEGAAQLTLSVPAQTEEIRADNNARSFSINVRRELLRVLVVDTLPRWEFRFLHNALSRDPGVEVKCLLLPPGMKPGSGANYIPAFPSSKEELSRFDVVFLGDIGIGPGELTTHDAELIKGLVEQQGSGLVFIPGPQGRQNTLTRSALGELFPVVLDPARARGVSADVPSQLVLTRRGSGHLLTMLASNEDLNYQLWRRLPGFYWNAAVEKSRPGSDVLAVHDTYRTQWGKAPLLVTRAAGNGKVLFLGIDSAWRWRRGVEDTYHYRFWGQVVRWMSYQRHLAHDQGMRLLMSPDNPRQGETVFLNATVLDQGGFPLSEGRVTVDVTFADGQTERLTLRAAPGGWGVFNGQFVARRGGPVTIRAHNPETGRSVETELAVQVREREQIGRPAQAAVLREIAGITQGRFGSPEELAEFVRQISALPQSPAAEQRLQLWCHPAWGAVLIFLMGVYWVGRKLLGLI
jgi:hypothetical protein